MGRQKRYPGAEKSINAFYASVSEAYNHPGADEKSRDGRKPQAFLAEEFGISRLKVRKILITTGDVEYPETKRIQELLARGMKKQDVCEYLNMAISTLNSFLPYEKGVYNLAEVSIYAESSRKYRERRAAVLALQSAPSSYKLWYCACLFTGYPFVTSEPGDQAGVKFRYEVRAAGDTDERQHAGPDAEGFGDELLVIRTAGGKQEKRINRGSLEDALKTVLGLRKKGEEITDPEQLNMEGAKYIFSMFKRFGVV